MHEVGIAQNIIEIVEEHVRKFHALTVSEVELDIGTISGVVPQSLEFAMTIASKGTMLEKAELKMNIIQAKAICSDCKNEFAMNDIFTFCPHCNSIQYEIIHGRELKVKSIKAE